MIESIDEAVLKLADMINDGVALVDESVIADQSHTQPNQALLQALAKINQITQNIRRHSHDTPDSLQQGDIWAHLEIIKKIGQGGIGEVYCAYDPILDHNVAVKFLSPNSQLYITQKQFLDEARHMAKVRHPHVLAIHGATVDNDIAGYWSDYLDGQLLSNLLVKKTTSWDQQLNFALDLCQAVKAIHSNLLVHGDIKALNVMVQPERGAILLDFGSSRKHDVESSDDYVQQASPLAMAPEQFQGQSANMATDVFSLGLVFWQLAAKSHPLENMPLENIKSELQHLSDFRHELNGPKSWQQLILQMVNPNSESRPLIKDVERALIHIRNSPARKAKQIATFSLLVLAAGITLVSTYSNIKTKQANKETETVNTLLSDILLSSSPLNQGKDVLLKDVLKNAETELLNNIEISNRQKIKSLSQLIHTYRTQGNSIQAIELANLLLTNYQLTTSERLDLLVQKADTLNRNRKFDESEALYLAASKILPKNKNDSDTLVLSQIGLVKNYIETSQLKSIPMLISSAKETWEQSNKSLSNLGLIYQIEGNYQEAMKQFELAFDLYQKAHENFESHYGKKNLNVLIAKGNAATVLTFNENTREQGAQMMSELVLEMNDFLGPEHRSTLIARANLSSIYGQLNKPDLGIDTIVPYMPYVYLTFGDEGGTTLAFENIVAELYAIAGAFDKANHIYEKIIDIQTRKHGVSAIPTIESGLKKVDFLQQAKQLDSAKDVLTGLQKIADDSYQTNERITLKITESVIWNQYLLGSMSAEKEMHQLIEKCIEIFGDKDPATLGAKERLNAMQQPKVKP